MKKDDNKIIHLYVIDKCDHDCPLCCNKQYDMEKVPVVTVEELKEAETICITGGEPFLYDRLMFFVRDLKEQYPNIQNVYVYTSGAAFEEWTHFRNIKYFDGINFGPKSSRDILAMKEMIRRDSLGIYNFLGRLKSNRIYVFDTLPQDEQDYFFSLNLPNTEIIPRSWQEEFEPNGGIFRRLPILFKDF